MSISLSVNLGEIITFSWENVADVYCTNIFLNNAAETNRYSAKIKNLQTEKSDVPIPYEEGPITTNIYSNQPLRKVRDKVDYIDFKIRYKEEDNLKVLGTPKEKNRITRNIIKKGNK